MPSPAPCPTPVGCPTPQPCSEIFDARCVRYTGTNILCDTDIVVTTNDTVAEALESIVDYVCNLPYTYEIGQYVASRGGVIFHRYKDGTNENYLVVDTTNISSVSFWSNIDNVAIGVTAQSTWDGLSNSNAIVAQVGFTSGAANGCLISTAVSFISIAVADALFFITIGVASLGKISVHVNLQASIGWLQYKDPRILVGPFRSIL